MHHGRIWFFLRLLTLFYFVGSKYFCIRKCTLKWIQVAYIVKEAVKTNLPSRLNHFYVLFIYQTVRFLTLSQKGSRDLRLDQNHKWSIFLVSRIVHEFCCDCRGMPRYNQKIIISCFDRWKTKLLFTVQMQFRKVQMGSNFRIMSRICNELM